MVFVLQRPVTGRPVTRASIYATPRTTPPPPGGIIIRRSRSRSAAGYATPKYHRCVCSIVTNHIPQPLIAHRILLFFCFWIVFGFLDFCLSAFVSVYKTLRKSSDWHFLFPRMQLKRENFSNCFYPSLQRNQQMISHFHSKDEWFRV